MLIRTVALILLATGPVSACGGAEPGAASPAAETGTALSPENSTSGPVGEPSTAASSEPAAATEPAEPTAGAETGSATEASAAGPATPDFTVVLGDGTPFTLSGVRGQPVVLTFFAEW